MFIPFYILAALLIYFSFKSFRGGVAYLKYFREELARPAAGCAPFATVIAPCKGLEEGLEENLSALFEQEYPEYEIIFVVDDGNDPAVGVIDEGISRKAAETQSSEELRLHLASSRLRGKIPARLVIAPKAGASAQKTENLREAVLHADPRSEVFVFVDSDARPAKDWLRNLVAPLADESIGAATGYRWFIPLRSTFAAELRSAWNASIASALGPNMRSNFLWGGSTAIRRETFERLRVRERWHGTVSDDFVLARVLGEAGLQTHFVPQALTPSTDGCSFAEMIEFTTRQMKITRVYAPHFWIASFLGSGLFTIVMVAAFAIIIFSGTNGLPVWAALATLALVSVFSIGKAWLRLRAVSLIVPRAERQLIPQLTLWLITPPLFLYNCILASFSRRITWRGVTYELVSEKQTRLIG